MMGQKVEASEIPKEMINLVKLERGCATEIWHASKLNFGNVVEKVPGKNSIAVKLKSGEQITIDPGQIIDIWSRHDTSVPLTTDDWVAVEKQSRKLLHKLPARGLDLTHLWKYARLQGKQYKLTSYEAADYLFNCPVNAKKGYMFDPNKDDWHPSSAQLCAAALALSVDVHRFKRRPSQKASGQVGEDPESTWIELGGYKALNQATVTSREVISFADLVKGNEDEKDLETVKETTSNEKFMRLTPSQLQLVHELEIIAIGGVQPLSSAAKQAFSQLGKEISKESAKEILLSLGYWSEMSKAPSTRNITDLYTPFPPDAVEKAKELRKQAMQKRLDYAKLPAPRKFGSLTSFSNGRLDLRGFQTVYCIDNEGTRIMDDAISFDAKSKEVYVHIADVCSLISQEMIEAARMRVQADYLPGAQLFLLPPSTLDGLALSKTAPNECISLAMKLDKNGEVAAYKFLLTLIDPVISLKYKEANKLLKSSETDMSKDLRSIAQAVLKGRRLEASKKLYSDIKKGFKGTLKVDTFESTPAHLLVDALLDMYSTLAIEYCNENARAPPLARGAASVRGGGRFGTAPLRRYVDILAQQQLLSILLQKPGLSKKHIIEEIKWIGWKRSQLVKLKSASQHKQLIERLARHCAEVTQATGLTCAVLEAIATGNGREVMLKGFGLRGNAKVNKAKISNASNKSSDANKCFQKGQKLQVKVLHVSPASRKIALEEYTS